MDQPGSAGAAVRDGLRLAVGTFSVIPVRVPEINRRTAAVAMTAAPAVGVALGVVVGVGVEVAWERTTSI